MNSAVSDTSTNSSEFDATSATGPTSVTVPSSPAEKDPISVEARTMIAKEETICENTLTALTLQQQEQERRFHRERLRARDLTATLVQSRRDEERAMVASDEAVSHALAHHHDETLDVLRTLREKPYFGRVLLEEEDEKTGDTREIEYKIGYAANAECRIIDWRKAPLSKLYYEYKEGEDYHEVIQGRERSGRVLLRNRVEIDKGELLQIDSSLGSYRRINGEWGAASSTQRQPRDLGSLPDVLSLITPEQFATITHDASSAVLLQGVAGSGKTTVALHRLSWLLAQQESRLCPEDAVVLTLGPSMSAYIKGTLPQFGVDGVKVFSYREWSGALIAPLLPPSLLVPSESGESLPVLSNGSLRAPSTIERVKKSVGLLLSIEERARTTISQPLSPLQLLLAALSDSRRVIQLDDSRLLTEQLVRDAYLRTLDIETRGTLDRTDFSLLLRCAQVLGRIVGRASFPHGPFKHIVVDEVQDYSPIELATVLSTLTREGTLTLVGDVAQRTEDGFPGWKRLQGWWNGQKRSSSFVKLEVSHRCTREIMRCAELLGRNDDSSHSHHSSAGRPGAKPRWLIGRDQEHALAGLIDWLHTRSRENPNALLAVISFSHASCRELRTLLAPTFGVAVRYVGEDGISFDQGIVIGDPQSLKGLEFYGVAVWGAMKKELPEGELGANLLYIAATRAQEHLAFLTWGRSSTPLGRISSAFLQREELEEIERQDSLANPFAETPLGGSDDGLR